MGRSPTHAGWNHWPTAGSTLLFAVSVLIVAMLSSPIESSAQAPGCDPADNCCSQCDLSSTMAGTCPNDIPFEDYEDLDTTRIDWLANLAFWDGCDPGDYLGAMGLVEGECGNGTTWIHRRALFSADVRFFDAGGAFTSLVSDGDIYFQECRTATHYPTFAVCPQPTVTQIHCGLWWDLWIGEPIAVGQAILLPRVLTPHATPLADPMLLIPGFFALGLRRLRRRTSSDG